MGENNSFPIKTARRSIDDLFRLSESRGKEAAGIALLNREEISVYKTPISASRMIKMDSYKNLLERHIAGSTAEKNGILFGRSIQHTSRDTVSSSYTNTSNGMRKKSCLH